MRKSQMKLPIKNLIWGVAVTIVGTAILTTGISFSETVNPVSVLGILLGAQALTMGQILVIRAGWNIRATSLAAIKQSAANL
jgi:hypothetical protein